MIPEVKTEVNRELLPPVKIGNQYHNLEIIGRDPKSKRGLSLWRCKCKCGKIVSKTTSSLRRGNVQWCGWYCKARPKKTIIEDAEMGRRIRVRRSKMAKEMKIVERMVDHGYTLREIGQKLGISRQAVCNRLNRDNWKDSRSRNKPRSNNTDKDD